MIFAGFTRTYPRISKHPPYTDRHRFHVCKTSRNLASRFRKIPASGFSGWLECHRRDTIKLLIKKCNWFMIETVFFYQLGHKRLLLLRVHFHLIWFYVLFVVDVRQWKKEQKWNFKSSIILRNLLVIELKFVDRGRILRGGVQHNTMLTLTLACPVYP